MTGGIGGVEGGMIGAFLAFGVQGRLAVIAVLGYRTISYGFPRFRAPLTTGACDTASPPSTISSSPATGDRDQKRSSELARSSRRRGKRVCGPLPSVTVGGIMSSRNAAVIGADGGGHRRDR